MPKAVFSPSSLARRDELVDALDALKGRLTRRENVFLASRHVYALKHAKSAGDLFFAADNATMFLVRFGKVAPAKYVQANPNAPRPVKAIDAPPPSDDELIAAFLASGRTIDVCPTAEAKRASSASRASTSSTPREPPKRKDWAGDALKDLIARGVIPASVLAR
jgi:hypothetical protein